MDLDVRDEVALGRYEAWADDALAGWADYEAGEGILSFTHTEVEPAFEGKGVGSALIQGALDDVRAHRPGWSVLPVCPFVVSWIERHPAYQDLLADASE